MDRMERIVRSSRSAQRLFKITNFEPKFGFEFDLKFGRGLGLDLGKKLNINSF